MPKVTKIHDPLNQAPPLRVTETKEHRTKKNRITGASILVRCGCCKEKLRILRPEKVKPGRKATAVLRSTG